MASTKTAANPYKWPNGQYHSIPWAQEEANQRAAAAAALQAQQNAIRVAAQNRAQSGVTPTIPGGTVAPSAGPAQNPQPETISYTPPPPPPLDPFFTPDDINAMGEWLRSANDNRATVDSSLNTARTDTSYQSGQLDQSAKKTSNEAAENMAARGLFQSSVKDAALFDIEAQRATQQGFLQDRLKQVQSEHDAWVGRYGGTMSSGQKVAGSEEEAKTIGAPMGTEVAAFYQRMAGKAAQNASEVNAARPAPATVTIPNPAFHPIASAGTAKGITVPTSAAAAATAALPNGASTLTAGTDANGRPLPGNTVTTNAKKKTKTYTASVRTP